MTVPDHLRALIDAPLANPNRSAFILRRQEKACRPFPLGSGPPGQTCKTCAHIERVRYAKVYIKCGLMRSAWTRGAGTDIRAGDPACAKWEPAGPSAQKKAGAP